MDYGANVSLGSLIEYCLIDLNTEVGANQLENIVRLNHDIFKGMYENEPYSLDFYREKIKNKTILFLVAKLNNQMVGDSISFERDGSLYIWIMGVAEKHRNIGIASELLNYNEKYARSNKYGSITIKVYNVSKEMLKLLLARGYQVFKVDISNNDIKHNAIHLKLILKEKNG